MIKRTSKNLVASYQLDYDEPTIRSLSHTFSKNGMVIMPKLIDDDVHSIVKGEAFQLLQMVSNRIDLTLSTTDNTPRKMTIVSHSDMVKHSRKIKDVYEDLELKNLLEKIAGEKMEAYISDDEGLFIAKQDKPGDTHGWHWGDYSYALIWVLETPPIANGGMLQCVPHTSWDKSNPSINQYLCNNKIDTYGFKSGDIYFLKANTTLHRTVELRESTTRVIINMTWGTESDRHRFRLQKTKDDWWQNQDISTVSAIS